MSASASVGRPVGLGPEALHHPELDPFRVTVRQTLNQKRFKVGPLRTFFFLYLGPRAGLPLAPAFLSVASLAPRRHLRSDTSGGIDSLVSSLAKDLSGLRC